MNTNNERIDVLAVLNTAERAAVAELIEALRGLVYECETNMDFATEHKSELDALTAANEVLARVGAP